MRTETKSMKIKDLLALEKKNSLIVNAEYQRAEVWKDTQKKRLIDSILRGFPIPKMILYQRDTSIDKYEIVDGQQRNSAIRDFYDNDDFKLLDVSIPKNKFPTYLRAFSCEWANKNFHNLPERIKNEFLNYELTVCIISNAGDDELRDVFIRLQSGAPLSSQETRDAMPGEFSEFIREIGGIGNEAGHDFIETFVKKNRIDRGKIRQLIAQMFLLFIELETNARFVDIKSQILDELYYEYINMDSISIYKNRFVDVLNDLYDAIEETKMENYEIIHLYLLAKECKNLGLISWKDKIMGAFIRFKNECEKYKKDNRSSYWIEYLAKTRTDASKSTNIRDRHKFYSEKMFSFMYGTASTMDVINIEVDSYIKRHALYSEYVELQSSDKYYVYDEIMEFLSCGNQRQLDNENVEVAKINETIREVNQNIIEGKGGSVDGLKRVVEILEAEKERLLNAKTSNVVKKKQDVHRLTKVVATKKDGTMVNANSFGSLVPEIYPVEFGDGRSRNYPGLILGTDRGLSIFERFWIDYDYVEFLMNNRKYKVKRSDFKDFWPNRFPELQ